MSTKIRIWYGDDGCPIGQGQNRRGKIVVDAVNECDAFITAHKDPISY
jgi:hypothetical protein